MKEIDILTIPRDTLPKEIFSRPFFNVESEYLFDIFRKASYRWRPSIEENELYKQIIPYIAFISRNRVLSYKRTEKGAEDRLHHRFSVGIGGHVDSPDNFWDAAEREIMEEIGMTLSRSSLEVVGMINDETDSVGKVHLGIALVAHVDDSAVFSGGETDVLVEREWTGKDDFFGRYDSYESWSKIFFDHYLAKVL